MSPIEPDVEWTRLWTDPAMLRLRHDRRNFFLRAWAIYAVSFGTLLGVAAFAPGVMAHQLVSGLSTGIVLALIYVVTVMGLGAWYVRRARRWDILAAAVLSTSAAKTITKETARV